MNLLELPDLADIRPDDMAWLLYSSGTTGIPKGIVHTHYNVNTIPCGPWSVNVCSQLQHVKVFELAYSIRSLMNQ